MPLWWSNSRMPFPLPIHDVSWMRDPQGRERERLKAHVGLYCDSTCSFAVHFLHVSLVCSRKETILFLSRRMSLQLWESSFFHIEKSREKKGDNPYGSRLFPFRSNSMDNDDNNERSLLVSLEKRTRSRCVSAGLKTSSSCFLIVLSLSLTSFACLVGSLSALPLFAACVYSLPFFVLFSVMFVFAIPSMRLLLSLVLIIHLLVFPSNLSSLLMHINVILVFRTEDLCCPSLSRR